MGLGLTIIKFVGIPAAVIVGVGAALNFFRPQIFQSARSVGEVFTGIFTQPFEGAINQINESLGNLPDIDIDIPSFNIGGGGFNFNFPDITKAFEDLSNFISGGDTPPSPSPTPEIGRDDPRRDSEPKLTLLGGSLPVSLSSGTERIARSEIIERFPGTLALFDLRATEKTEFLPFDAAGILSAKEQGLELRVSGQIFQERPGLKLLLGA